MICHLVQCEEKSGTARQQKEPRLNVSESRGGALSLE
jgi:hypothetical protein